MRYIYKLIDATAGRERTVEAESHVYETGLEFDHDSVAGRPTLHDDQNEVIGVYVVESWHRDDTEK